MIARLDQSTGQPGQSAWTLAGSRDNWLVALEHGQWGVDEKYLQDWHALRAGDLLLFYAKRPISKLIGHAAVAGTRIDRARLWPAEFLQDAVKYPLRIEFRDVRVLPEEQWYLKGVEAGGIVHIGGLNPLETALAVDTIAKLRDALASR